MRSQVWNCKDVYGKKAFPFDMESFYIQQKTLFYFTTCKVHAPGQAEMRFVQQSYILCQIQSAYSSVDRMIGATFKSAI